MGALRAMVLCLALALPGTATAQEPAPAPPPFTIFDLPALLEEQRRASVLIRAGEPKAALDRLTRLIARYPEIAEPYAVRAAAEAAIGAPDAALASLTRAVELGFRGVASLLRDPAFGTARADPRFAALAAEAASLPPGEPAFEPAEPAEIVDGRALILPTNTGWDQGRNALVALFEDPGDADAPPGPIAADAVGEPVAGLLAGWATAGTAAGNHGDLYDNRDDGHSALAPGLFRQLARTEYGPEATRAGLARGLAHRLMFNRITFGNSSTALTSGPLWRSQARHAMTRPLLALRLYQQHALNHLYVYPEHKDHDRLLGDLFPANTAYVIVSRGSSGSDRPFLRAVAVILASLRPEVKARLAAEGLVAPTVQMILRRGMAGIGSREAYLSGAAHPSAFDAERIDLARMAWRAQTLGEDDIPPAVRLQVLEESRPEIGIDVMGPNRDERLFDTPGAIARVVRSTAHIRRMRVSAEATRDPNGHPLKFHWVVLRGDPARISIETDGETGEVATLSIPWHDRRTLPGEIPRATDRVDIGVFADNGRSLSAPAFITLAYPPRQKRVYAPDGRILEVDYSALSHAKRYSDPMLFPDRDWRDAYAYDAAGRLTGWTRHSGGVSMRFTEQGMLVRAEDAEGRPVEAEAVRYTAEPDGKGGHRIVWGPTGRLFAIRYAGPEDAIGTHVPLGD